MAKNKFKVGDIIKSNCPDGIKKAEVVGIVNERCVVIKPLEHDLACMLRMEIPVLSEDFEKIAEETIVIYRKDNKIIALDKSTGEKAEARCHPADDFDFHIGARIAFERLTGTEKKSVVKEVKRPAKVGERIKIVDAHPTACGTFYKNGDVFIVMNTKMIGNEEVVSLSNMLGDYIRQCEYVVLENYEPDKEESITDEMVESLKNLGKCIRILKEDGLSTEEAIKVIKDIILRK